MHRWQNVILSVGAAAAVGLGTFSFGYSMGKDDASEIEGRIGAGEGLALIRDAFQQILSTSVDPPSAKSLARGAVRGMVEVLRESNDPYALFYTPKSFQSLQELTTGRFSGIGVWLKDREGQLEIVSVIPSTPARQAGLKRGDVIESIDGKAVRAMTEDEAVARIKGRPGSEVALVVDRNGTQRDFTITRERIELPSLRATMAGNDLGYIQLLGFASGARAQMRGEIERLIDLGARGLLLDLRDNGGGLFTEAIDVASLFIEDGDVVRYKEKTEPVETYEANGDAFEKIPLVVLVNEGTASASEIVAGALQDRDRAVLVGTTTYGKGSVQELVHLADDSVVKLTAATYLTPDGRNINLTGIEPDVEVNAGPREQRQDALEILEGIILSSNNSQG